MKNLDARLRAVCNLLVPEVREAGGRHEYDGWVQDLSPEGVRKGLAALGTGDPPGDPHDAAHLRVFEEYLRTVYRDLELHRTNLLLHLTNLDLACYDREYAPAAERAAAKRAHLARWPDGVDGALAALDQLSMPVAQALLGAVRGLAAGVPQGADAGTHRTALAAHAGLVANVEKAATAGPPDVALGADRLARLLGAADGMVVNLTEVARRAEAERERVTDRLVRACARIDDRRPAMDVARQLVQEYSGIDGVLDAARQWTERALRFTRERDLIPYHDGECRVGLAPESRRWATAMMAWAAPGELDGPSWYHITPPDPYWPQAETAQWLQMFSPTTLAAITVHEVAPGHFSHGRALRHAPTEVRRILQSAAFVEGWAHYAEELCVEEGFCADDPRFEIGVWLEALIRITRLVCAIGYHSGAMSVADGTRRFIRDTHIAGPAARSEAQRATYDPTYGRYTLGKLAILDLRERARAAWGSGFSPHRFHHAMLRLGAPPLGLLPASLDR